MGSAFYRYRGGGGQAEEQVQVAWGRAIWPGQFNSTATAIGDDASGVAPRRASGMRVAAKGCQGNAVWGKTRGAGAGLGSGSTHGRPGGAGAGVRRRRRQGARRKGGGI